MRYQQTIYNHMSTNQLADYWGISARTLERWRGIGNGPHFVKVGGRVLYRVEDILEYEDILGSTRTFWRHSGTPIDILRHSGTPII